MARSAAAFSSVSSTVGVGRRKYHFSRYGVTNRVQTVFPANRDVELHELPTVNEYKPLVNEDSDDETMEERKKKSQRREKEFNDNGFSLLPGSILANCLQ